MYEILADVCKKLPVLHTLTSYSCIEKKDWLRMVSFSFDENNDWSVVTL